MASGEVLEGAYPDEIPAAWREEEESFPEPYTVPLARVRILLRVAPYPRNARTRTFTVGGADVCRMVDSSPLAGFRVEHMIGGVRFISEKNELELTNEVQHMIKVHFYLGDISMEVEELHELARGSTVEVPLALPVEGMMCLDGVPVASGRLEHSGSEGFVVTCKKEISPGVRETIEAAFRESV